MIRLGIIGLGEVSQLMHLPILQDLTEDYAVTAVSDVAPSLVSYIQKKYHVKDAYLDGAQLIREGEIDAVLILAPDQYHGEYARLALERGLHVFVEKPVTLCRAELDELIALKKQYPKQIVMVGYMRRYASPLLRAKQIMEEDARPIRHLRFRDIICEGPFYIGQTRPIFYPKDVPQAAIDEGGKRKRAQLDAALGADATDAQRKAYTMLTGLGCHSFSAVRELVGYPKKILSVATCCGGEHMVVVMDYGDFLATYELVNDQSIVEFDACVEVYQGDRKLRLKYETPYIRYMPLTLEVTDSTAHDTHTTVYGPDHTDPFQTELKTFAECIKTGAQPKTVLEDAAPDFELFEEIIRVMGKEGK